LKRRKNDGRLRDFFYLELIISEEGEGVVLEEDLLEGGGLVEQGGGEGGQAVVRHVQQRQGPQPYNTLKYY
jgi:hypothetical protein